METLLLQLFNWSACRKLEDISNLVAGRATLKTNTCTLEIKKSRLKEGNGWNLFSLMFFSSTAAPLGLDHLQQRPTKHNIPLTLTRRPAACGSESHSFRSARSSKKPPRSWGSIPWSRRRRTLQRSTAATPPAVPATALSSQKWGVQNSVGHSWDCCQLVRPGNLSGFYSLRGDC